MLDGSMSVPAPLNTSKPYNLRTFPNNPQICGVFDLDHIAG